jgi:hypothetical protein
MAVHFALALVILAAGNATIAIALISDNSAPPLIPTFCGIAAIGVGVALAHPQLSGGTGRGARLAARTSGRVKKVEPPGARHPRTETAGGGPGLATAFFPWRLYIVAAVSE